MNIDINKKYRTRNGSEVVIYTTSAPRTDYPVVGSIRSKHGEWIVTEWSAEGRYFNGDSDADNRDLIEAREPREYLLKCTKINGVLDLRLWTGSLPEEGEEIRVREIIDPA